MDDLIDAFRVFDQDKDGKLGVEEFKFAMKNLGEKMHDHEVDEILAESDLAYDGFISIEEFAKLIKNR